MAQPALAPATPTRLVFIPVSKNVCSQAAVLDDPAKFSDFFMQHQKFANSEEASSIDRGIAQPTYDSAACCIVIGPNGITCVPPQKFTQWIFVPVDRVTNLEPIVLENPTKFSDFFVQHQQGVKFKDFTKDVVFDQDVDLGEQKLDIAARHIVVYPNVTVRAEEIALRALNGYFNFGMLDYTSIEKMAPRGYSNLETSSTRGALVRNSGNCNDSAIWLNSKYLYS